jgi:hypothetical protein
MSKEEEHKAEEENWFKWSKWAVGITLVLIVLVIIFIACKILESHDTYIVKQGHGCKQHWHPLGLIQWLGCNLGWLF